MEQDLQIRIVGSAKEMDDALSVRRAVFIDEQGVSEREEIDDYDDVSRLSKDAVHAITYLDGRPVATGRLLLDALSTENAQSDARLLAHIIGAAEAVMLALHEEAQRRGYSGITLASQLPAIPFYERLGYRARGGVFLDAGIEHRWMDLPF
jgi:predicted GNAT family N-acyltransferase